MASQGHFLLCPKCNKTQDTLSVHLGRVCMNTSTPEDITAVVNKAKMDAQELLVSGRVISYHVLHLIMAHPDPLSRLIEELQRRHIVVTDVPSRDARIAARCAAQEPRNQQMDIHAAFDQLLQTHPVTLNGSAPDRITRSEFSQRFERNLYGHWLKAQMTMRTQHVLSHFNRRLPTEQRVDAWITKQGWKSNLPKAERIVGEWKPFGSVAEVMDSKVIRRLATSQKWKGLLVADIEGKGKGVVATRRFQAGEVVCDYHGQVVTAKEGWKIHLNTSEEETGYMFFYTNKNQQKMSIDAHSASCDCHPDKQTFGRLINHSKSKSNLRPRLYTVDIDGQEKDVILFLAKRNIDVNEELLFNYGVERKSFRGEGLELDWL